MSTTSIVVVFCHIISFLSLVYPGALIKKSYIGRKKMNEELQAVFEEDQADRSTFFEQLDHEQLRQVLQRDRARRQRVEELVESEALQTSEDYFHAAMIFQHGE